MLARYQVWLTIESRVCESTRVRALFQTLLSGKLHAILSCSTVRAINELPKIKLERGK